MFKEMTLGLMFVLPVAMAPALYAADTQPTADPGTETVDEDTPSTENIDLGAGQLQNDLTDDDEKVSSDLDSDDVTVEEMLKTQQDMDNEAEDTEILSDTMSATEDMDNAVAENIDEQ